MFGFNDLHDQLEPKGGKNPAMPDVSTEVLDRHVVWPAAGCGHDDGHFRSIVVAVDGPQRAVSGAVLGDLMAGQLTRFPARIRSSASNFFRDDAAFNVASASCRPTGEKRGLFRRANCSSSDRPASLVIAPPHLLRTNAIRRHRGRCPQPI
jgi:hypothetical protein